MEKVFRFDINLATQCLFCAVLWWDFLAIFSGQLWLSQSFLPSEAKLKDRAVTAQALKNRAWPQLQSSTYELHTKQSSLEWRGWFSDDQNKTEWKLQSQMPDVGKKALSGKGDDWIVQYSQATAITMIGFTLLNIWLSKQNAECIRATSLC